jgi:DNA-directed RNA polymerase subunit RPC12/RpoP
MREKLIEAVGSFKFPIESRGCTIGEYIVPYSIQEPLVDHLIANDVTIQETGYWEWDTEDIYKCSHCGDKVHVKEVMGQPDWGFCPACGARMLPEPPKGE